MSSTRTSSPVFSELFKHGLNIPLLPARHVPPVLLLSFSTTTILSVAALWKYSSWSACLSASCCEQYWNCPSRTFHGIISNFLSPKINTSGAFRVLLAIFRGSGSPISASFHIFCRRRSLPFFQTWEIIGVLVACFAGSDSPLSPSFCIISRRRNLPFQALEPFPVVTVVTTYLWNERYILFRPSHKLPLLLKISTADSARCKHPRRCNKVLYAQFYDKSLSYFSVL